MCAWIAVNRTSLMGSPVMTACTKSALGYPLHHRQARNRLRHRQVQRQSVSTVAHGTTRSNDAPIVLVRGLETRATSGTQV
jgi:hypothetical protein